MRAVAVCHSNAEDRHDVSYVWVHHLYICSLSVLTNSILVCVTNFFLRQTMAIFTMNYFETMTRHLQNDS